MMLKPAPPEAGHGSLDAFRDQVELHSQLLTDRAFRSLHRKALAH